MPVNPLVTQLDALKELINIGYGRAAGRLSDLTGERVTLDVPKVEVAFLRDIRPSLRTVFKQEVWTVHQVFGGHLKGHAMLMVDEKTARTLTRCVVKDKPPREEEPAVMQEVLTEIGNIVLQGAMGICGEVLKVQLRFSVPGLRIEGIETMLNSAVVGDEEVQYALLIRTRFQIVAKQVTGYLVVVLGVTSFSRLMEAVDAWEKS